MFHVPVGIKDEALSRLPLRHTDKDIARYGIKPHQPVWARKPHQLVVRGVDHRDAFFKAPLLSQRVAIVERNRLTDGPRKPEQRGGHVLALTPEEVDQHNS